MSLIQNSLKSYQICPKGSSLPKLDGINDSTLATYKIGWIAKYSLYHGSVAETHYICSGLAKMLSVLIPFTLNAAMPVGAVSNISTSSGATTPDCLISQDLVP